MAKKVKKVRRCRVCGKPMKGRGDLHTRCAVRYTKRNVPRW